MIKEKNVNEKVFYHIQRNPTWKIGENYVYGNKVNYFYNHMYEIGTNCMCTNPITHDCIPINPLILAKEVLKINSGGFKDPFLEKYFHYNPLKTVEILHQTLTEYMKYTRESIFESVRNKSFPHKPSRIKGIWLIEDNNEAIHFWWNLLKKDGQKLFQVEATGNVHIADQKYLDLSADPLYKIEEVADKYWNSDIPNEPSFNECIFNGNIKVIAERNGNDI